MQLRAEADEILGDERDENIFDLEGEADEDLATREADTLRAVADRIEALL